MMADEQSVTQASNHLLKIIKDREKMYFEALNFTQKNIESSSNDLDQIYIFSKFLNGAKVIELELVHYQVNFLQGFLWGDELSPESRKIESNSKEMTRLLGRVQEIMEESVSKMQNSIFDENGKIKIEFSRLRKSLHKIVKNDQIDLHEFCNSIINFTKSKYRKQINRIETYLKKLETGEHVSLREMFSQKNGSDVSVSPDEKISKNRAGNIKRPLKFSEHSGSESPAKKGSVKKVNNLVTKPKRTLNLKSMVKRDESVGSDKPTKEKEQKSEKKMAAEKLLKFYAMLELNKKQFLEDYIFQKQAEEQQRKRLMNTLMQKNKVNNEQIKGYREKYKNLNFNNLPNPSSDEHCSMTRKDSVGSRVSMKTTFHITKRKPSFSFDTDKSDVEFKNEMIGSKTIRNLSSKKKTSNSSTPRPRKQSQKLFIVKPGKMFEDDAIPNVQLTRNSFIQQPLTGRTGPRRNQQLRRKRNQPTPLDDPFNYGKHPV